MMLKGKGNFIFGTRDWGYRPVSKCLPAAGMSSDPFVVGRKGEWTATDKTGVNADRANTAEQVNHAWTERPD